MQRRITALAIALLAILASLGLSCAPPAYADPPPQPWVNGVDVSVFQNAINWPAVKAAGNVFAFVKVSGSDPATIGANCAYGGNYRDGRGQSNLAGAQAAGLEVGAYHFACPNGDPRTDGINEANHFVSSGGCTGRLGPMLDLETSSLDANGTVIYAQWWADTVHRACGRTPVIYTGAYFSWSNDARLGALGPLFLAAYVQSPRTAGGWQQTTIWQYTGTGHVTGINGNVDRDVASASWFNSVTGGASTLWTPAEIQRVLGSWGFDCGNSGIYDPKTFFCVADFQTRFALPVDGSWGPQAQAAAVAWFFYLASLPKVQTPEEAAYAFVLSCYASTITDDVNPVCIKLAQSWLVHDGYSIAVDGTYSYETAGAIALFERDNGLPIDAKVTAPVWVSLTKAAG